MGIRPGETPPFKGADKRRERERRGKDGSEQWQGNPERRVSSKQKEETVSEKSAQLHRG